MARRFETRRRVRRSDEIALNSDDHRIERLMDNMIESIEEGEYESLVRHADAFADAAEQVTDLTER